MPIKADVFENLLIESGYDKTEMQFVIDSFRHGFSLGYVHTKNVRITAPNLKLAIGNETDLWNKVMKEVKLKRYAGPFSQIPYKTDYIQSPIGLVPKDNRTDMRLIFHLLYLRSAHGSTSVNANTPKEDCSVKYPNFADAIQLILDNVKKTGSCAIRKSDASSAFRNLSFEPRFWCYLIMKARLPIDHKWYYFVDKCLLFGAAISCSHFQRVSNAIKQIIVFKTKKDLINYLDDSICSDARIFL